MVYGSSIGKKFYEDGRVRPFRGNSVVADITARNPAYSVMLALRELVSAFEMDNYYTLLPPDGYHMTVIDGLVDEVRDEAHWPASLSSAASADEADAHVAAAVARAGLPTPFRMRFDAMRVTKNAIVACLIPDSDEEEQRARAFRDRAARKIGLTLPGHDTYRFHISLGYTRILPEGEAATRLEAMTAAMNALLAEQPPFTTGAPYMALFADMHAFSPVVDEAVLLRGYTTPNDDGLIAATDARSIQNAVDAALKTGLGRVVIPRYNRRTGGFRWDVDEAVILDSNLEIVLDNCYIRQVDGSMDNVFRNFPADGLQRRTLAEEQHHIIIRGVGNAVIDGGVGNGLTQKTSCTDGRPHIYMNNVILLHNLRDFRLENFTVANQRHWGIHLSFCEKGVIRGLNLTCRNDLRNQDGLDLRFGCNNILITDVTGQAGDDLIALTAIQGARAIEHYAVDGKCWDIHNIVIQNVIATSAECVLVGLRCQDGVKIHDITIDNVHDVMTSAEACGESTNRLNLDANRYELPKSPYALVRIGHDDPGYVHKRFCGPGDVYGIHVTNLHARCNAAVMLNGDIEDAYFGNIYAGNGVDRIVLTTGCCLRHFAGVDLRNVIIENVFYDRRDNARSVAFDLIQSHRSHRFDNVYIRHAFLGNCATAVNMQHDGMLALEDVHGDALKFTVDCGTVTLDGVPVSAN